MRISWKFLCCRYYAKYIDAFFFLTETSKQCCEIILFSFFKWRFWISERLFLSNLILLVSSTSEISEIFFLLALKKINYLIYLWFLAALGLQTHNGDCVLKGQESIAASGLSLVAVSRGYSLLQRLSHCSVFSCWGEQALGHVSFSSCGQRALECRRNNCGTWA